MKVTAYNTFGTKDASRVVAAVEVDVTDISKAIDKAFIYARNWNKTEKRDNMKVKFLVCAGRIRTV